MERQIIDWLKRNFPARPPVVVGIGDDAAVIETNARRMVITTDALVDGVHFRTAEHSWQSIGHKAVAVNLSDLAAMGATPEAVVITLVLPRGTSLNQIQDLYSGIGRLCDRYRMAIAGGDTNFSDGPLSISITAVGSLQSEFQPWLVSGAKIGDAVLVSGELGGSILERHLAFEPRCDLARHVAEHFQLHAVTDVSDGLLYNLGVITKASRCGALLNLNSIPISADAGKMADKKSPLEHALYDGEDFELILVTSPDEADRMLHDQRLPTPVTRIGQIDRGPGIRELHADGSESALDIRGYAHGPDGGNP